MNAKRARRKKRDREKGKKKGADDSEAAVVEVKEEDSGEVKFEERVQAWCTVRANAKVKSFSLATNEETVGSMGGIPVSISH